MKRSRRAALGGACLLTLAVLAGGCFGGDDGGSGADGPDLENIATATLPAELPTPRVLGESVVSTGGRRTYTIRSGDTLSSVADRFGVTLDDLIAANPGIDPTGLVDGDVINLPEGVTPVASTPAPEPTVAPEEPLEEPTEPPPAEIPTDTPIPPAPPTEAPPAPVETPTQQSLGSTYTVQSGDSFASIAGQYGLSIEALQDANPTVDPNALQPGQVLVIPPA